jgi:peptidoglycan/LPS O-acetylase OafA/YrhL
LLFFVLSGFVLTLSVRSSAEPTPAQFGIARFARIWLPFAVVIVGSAALTLLVAGAPVVGTSHWFNAQWAQGATAPNLARHLLMTGTAIDLDSPMWSLIHELRISLLFPLLVFTTVRHRDLTLLLSVILSVSCVYVLGHVPLAGTVSSLTSTGTYVYFFVIGIILATHTEKLQQLLCCMSKSVIGFLWILALAGLAIAPGDTSHVAALDSELLLLLNGLAAGLLILLSIVQGTAAKILLHRIPLFLGRISYSLYLTHVVVITSVVHALGSHVPVALAVVASIPISLVVSDICQRLIEAPSQQLGKQVAGAMGANKNVRSRFEDIELPESPELE